MKTDASLRGSDSTHIFWWPLFDDMDLDILRTALSSGVLSEVLLRGKGSYRYPFIDLHHGEQRYSDAHHRQSEARQAIVVCREHSAEPILLRSLWPDLPGQEPNDHMFDAGFYHKRFDLLEKEAGLFGIKAAFNMEPEKPQYDQPTTIYRIIRERSDIHDAVGPPLVQAMEQAVTLAGDSFPRYIVPGCVSSDSHLYSQIGQAPGFAASQRIAVPPSYGHDRSGQVTIEHAAMQWIFAADGEADGFNYASIADLAATSRRILIYADHRVPDGGGPRPIETVAADLAKLKPEPIPNPLTNSQRLDAVEARVATLETSDVQG